MDANAVFVELLEQLTAMTRLGSLHWQDLPGQEAFTAGHRKGEVETSFLLERSASESRDSMGIRQLECDYQLTVENVGPAATDKITIGDRELGSAEALEELFELVSATRKVETVRRVLGALRGGD